ncbi:MAG: acetylserotonin O-methyltransferase [Bacteroidales bacterium]|nr:acetylserotonin O-methyltransferase [Bacteroidales bacterium]
MRKLPPWVIYKWTFKIVSLLDKLKKWMLPNFVNVMIDLTGNAKTQIIYTGVKLGIFDTVRRKPKTVAEISKDLNIEEDALFRLIRALTFLDFLKLEDSNKYCLTTKGKLLTPNLPVGMKNQAIMMGDVWNNCFTQLDQSMKTGTKSLPAKYGNDFFRYLESNSDIAIIFNNSMEEITHYSLDAILVEFDYGKYQHIIDIGGGYGSLLFAILNKYSNTTGTLFDTESLIKGIKLQNSFVDRCKLVSGDFFKCVPNNGDLYLLKAIIHDWEDKDALIILENCRKAMKSDSRLLLYENSISKIENNWFKIYMDLLMLTALNGKERTISEISFLLSETGFKLGRVIETRSLYKIIEAIPI